MIGVALKKKMEVYHTHSFICKLVLHPPVGSTRHLDLTPKNLWFKNALGKSGCRDFACVFLFWGEQTRFNWSVSKNARVFHQKYEYNTTKYNQISPFEFPLQNGWTCDKYNLLFLVNWRFLDWGRVPFCSKLHLDHIQLSFCGNSFFLIFDSYVKTKTIL